MISDIGLTSTPCLVLDNVMDNQLDMYESNMIWFGLKILGSNLWLYCKAFLVMVDKVLGLW